MVEIVEGLVAIPAVLIVVAFLLCVLGMTGLEDERGNGNRPD